MSLLKKIQSLSDRNWYAPLIAIFAGLDAFILVVPIETLLVPSILIKPRRWWSSALWVTAGSGLGALALAYVVSIRGESYFAELAPKLYHSRVWSQSEVFMHSHGSWALAAIAASPFPQQPAVVFSTLVHAPLLGIFVSILIGRAIKYLVVCRLAAYAPQLLRRKKKAAA